MTWHQPPKLSQQNQPHHLTLQRKDARLNWLNLKKLKLKKQTAALKKRAVIQNMWHAINKLLLTGTMPIYTDPHHKARHQLMWHHVAAAKLMRWPRVARRRAAKVLAVANLEK
jgi:RecB family exonuclease